MTQPQPLPDANERYQCACGAVMAPEELRARVVLPSYVDPGYTEYCCPWCGGNELIEQGDE